MRPIFARFDFFISLEKLYMALKELDSNERARLTEIMIEFVGLIKDSKKIISK